MRDLSRQSFGPLPLPSDEKAELRILCESDVTVAYVRGMNYPDVRRSVSVGRGELDDALGLTEVSGNVF